jgi:hypothetical protein
LEFSAVEILNLLILSDSMFCLNAVYKLAASKLSKLHRIPLGIKEYFLSGSMMDEYCDKFISIHILFVAKNGSPNSVQLFLETLLIRFTGVYLC